LKNFPEVIPPEPPLKGRGRKGGRKGKGGDEGYKWGGVVWNREGEEGTELGGLHRRKEWEGRGGRRMT
jgi:hypothetical protein